MNRTHTAKRILTVILSLSIFAGCLLYLAPGAGALYYSEGQKLARAITDEGIVLLKNDNNTLPLAHGAAVALFGEAQRM